MKWPRLPRWLLIVLILAAIGAGALYWLSRPPPSITVASWGDAYQRAQTIALFHPFTDKSRIDVNQAVYGGGLREISDQVQSGSIGWDVVDMELEDAAAGCRKGVLEPLIGMELPPGLNGQAAERDFIPGAIGPCWIGSMVYGQVIAVDTQHFNGAVPAKLEDFFNLARFPGKRGLRDDGAKYNVELALMADGVPPWQVYPLLTTREGMARAFAKLDAIKPAIVWWKNVREPAELLMSGEVAMTTSLNARVFSAASPQIATLWDGQLYQMDVFAIPKGDPNKKRALDFLRFATGSIPLATEAAYLPYGPARRSALPLVGRNPETNEEMRPHLPTAPENFGRALEVDPDWWAKHGTELETRWTLWRNQASSSAAVGH